MDSANVGTANRCRRFHAAVLSFFRAHDDTSTTSAPYMARMPNATATGRNDARSGTSRSSGPKGTN
jgi:hypothetical protein